LDKLVRAELAEAPNLKFPLSVADVISFLNQVIATDDEVASPDKIAARVDLDVEPLTEFLGGNRNALPDPGPAMLDHYLTARKAEAGRGRTKGETHTTHAAATGGAFATASIAATATTLTNLLSLPVSEEPLYIWAWYAGMVVLMSMIVGGIAGAVERAFDPDPEELVAARTGMAWLFSVSLIFFQAFVSKLIADHASNSYSLARQ